MAKLVQNLEVGLDERLEEKLAWLVPNFSGYHIHRLSTDARRRRGAPRLIYTVEVFEPGETSRVERPIVERIAYRGNPVLIVGSGPAGLFAALRLVERGIPCHVFEQGSECGARLKAINRYWRYGELDPRNNVGFGEGGAGLYSDGKLITRIKSPHIPYVMDRLIQFGAPEEIRYLANPHVGSDKIRRLIPVLRQFLLENGATIHFDTKVTKLLARPAGGGSASANEITGLETEDGRQFLGSRVILACGHSATDLFHHLHEAGVFMEGKSFAIGLRIEHPQSHINRLQFREYCDHPRLGAASYKLAHTDDRTRVGVYSFCMCPGGYVLSAGTEPDRVVVNGMSNYHRNSPFANAALVVSVDYATRFGSDLFAGLNWRDELEREAYAMVQAAGGTKQIPAQRLEDFMNDRGGTVGKSSSPSGVVAARLDQLLPTDLRKSLRSGIEQFERWMKGFIHPEALLHGIESRTSCPLRITRHKDSLQSLSHLGLYPCGEGAGYAGGITSAACDGIAIAEAIVAEEASRATCAVADPNS